MSITPGGALKCIGVWGLIMGLQAVLTAAGLHRSPSPQGVYLCVFLLGSCFYLPLFLNAALCSDATQTVQFVQAYGLSKRVTRIEAVTQSRNTVRFNVPANVSVLNGTSLEIQYVDGHFYPLITRFQYQGTWQPCVW